MTEIQPTSDLSPGDVIRSLFRHAKKAILVFLLVVMATFAWIVFVPAEYESVAKVYVRVGRENNTLDPSATTGQTINIEQTLESEINSMLQIIGSRETAERVVSEIGADVILANDLPDEDLVGTTSGETKKRKFSLSSSLKKWISQIKSAVLPNRFPESRESLAVRAVLKRSHVWAPKQSNVIEISYKSRHPRLAQMVTETLTDVFVDEHLRVSKTEGTLHFFVHQTEDLKDELVAVEEALKKAKTASSLVSTDGQRQILEDQAKSIRTRALANQSLLQSSQAKIKELKSILDVLPARVDTDQRTAESHEGWYKLREKLFDLQIREHELRSKYSDQKAEVIAVVQQREAIEKILEAQQKSTTESVSAPNLTYQMFQQNLLNEQAQLVALMAEQTSLDKQLKANLEEFKQLNQSALEIGELERQRLIIETSYLASAAKTEQAKILEGLESAKISSINRLQNASFDVQPVGLGRLKTLVLGAFFGLVLGLGVAFTAAYFDRSFVTVNQVENALDVPVLVTIPQGRRQLMEVS